MQGRDLKEKPRKHATHFSTVQTSMWNVMLVTVLGTFDGINSRKSGVFTGFTMRSKVGLKNILRQ